MKKKPRKKTAPKKQSKSKVTSKATSKVTPKAKPKKKAATKKPSGKDVAVKKKAAGKSTSGDKQATSRKTTSKVTSPKKAAASKTSAKKLTVKKSSLKQAAATGSSGSKADRKASTSRPAKRSFAQNVTAKENRLAGGRAGSGSKVGTAATGRASFGNGPGSPPTHNGNGEAISLDELSASQLKRAKSGLKRKDLLFFRSELLERRAEILGDVANLDLARNDFGGEISHVPLHMADVGSENYDREFNLGLLESEKKLLRQIDEALVRIANGTYGVCHVTGKPIERIRLEIKPWAKYGIEIARERERRGMPS